MSKLSLTNRVEQKFRQQNLTDVVFAIQTQVNALSEGKISARYQAASVSPTTGDYAQGDIVWNLGVSATGFVGWVCITSGSPGSWTTWGAVT